MNVILIVVVGSVNNGAKYRGHVELRSKKSAVLLGQDEAFCCQTLHSAAADLHSCKLV